MSIRKHFFDDDQITVYNAEDDLNYIEFNSMHDIWYLERDDVIALAKHFKLTEEDLK